MVKKATAKKATAKRIKKRVFEYYKTSLRI
jgi:hypothetical protein